MAIYSGASRPYWYPISYGLPFRITTGITPGGGRYVPDTGPIFGAVPDRVPEIDGMQDDRSEEQAEDRSVEPIVPAAATAGTRIRRMRKIEGKKTIRLWELFMDPVFGRQEYIFWDWIVEIRIIDDPRRFNISGPGIRVIHHVP